MKVRVNLKLLKGLRETRKKSISDLSYHLGYKTPTAYWMLEQGSRNISVEVLYKLSVLKLFLAPSISDF
jgi:transcriptional regulator with XRE-family HTH domain